HRGLPQAPSRRLRLLQRRCNGVARSVEQDPSMSSDLFERTIVVGGGFQGLPGIAHGGYVAGLLARALGSSGAEVRLRRPVQVDRRLCLERRNGAAVGLRDGETLLAEATLAEPSIQVPLPVSPAEAEAAAQRFLGFEGHAASCCFVCGTDRQT